MKSWNHMKKLKNHEIYHRCQQTANPTTVRNKCKALPPRPKPGGNWLGLKRLREIGGDTNAKANPPQNNRNASPETRSLVLSPKDVSFFKGRTLKNPKRKSFEEMTMTEKCIPKHPKTNIWNWETDTNAQTLTPPLGIRRQNDSWAKPPQERSPWPGLQHLQLEPVEPDDPQLQICLSNWVFSF